MSYLKGRNEARWEIASYVASFILNTNVTKKSHCKTPDELNPYSRINQRKKELSTEKDLEEFSKLL